MPRNAPSPRTTERLQRIPLARLVPHPANPNLMDADLQERLARQIARNGRYPPLIVRPHPERADDWQILDGHQRVAVLRAQGVRDAVCYPWPCDDATALLLLATLNRLAGQDVVVKRAALLAELEAKLTPGDLATLLPESPAEITATLAVLDLDADALLHDLEAAAAHTAASATRTVAVAVQPDEEAVIEAAIAAAQGATPGRIRRGTALAAICRQYRADPDA